MKSLLTSKKSIIAISVLFLTILIMTISMCCFNDNRYSTHASSNLDTLSAADSDSNISTYGYYDDATAYIDYDLKMALSDISNIIQARNNGSEKEIKIISLTESDYSYFTTPNLSQSYYNKKLKENNYIQNNITNTCSLIAMIMVINIMSLNSDLEIEYNDNGNAEVRNILIFKDLYEIATDLYKNNYSISSDSSGTKTSTISKILQSYYAKHGINIDISENYFYDNVRDSLYDKVRIPAVLSIYKYYAENTYYDNIGHSVALKGEIIYETKYRYYKSKYDLIGTLYTKDFYLFVISDGWYNCDDEEIGDNLQILVIEDDSDYAHECGFKGWLDYEK
ncbi:MAG: hypothetical protein HDT29_00395 [Clostridiales bacterium]|nr:hypothetical protein [Clostridiales bacterium]